jgi:hypothetical protein
MKKTILLVLVLVLAAALAAQTLPLDSRRRVMQFERSYELLTYAPTADTLWHSVTVPARTTSITLVGTTGSLGVAMDSLYVVKAVGYKKYVTLPKDAAWNLPAIGLTKIWVRRAAAGTASVANIIFKKM